MGHEHRYPGEEMLVPVRFLETSSSSWCSLEQITAATYCLLINEPGTMRKAGTGMVPLQAQYTPTSCSPPHRCLQSPLPFCEWLQTRRYSTAITTKMKLEASLENFTALQNCAAHLLRPTHSHFCQSGLPLRTFLPWQFFSHTSEKGIWGSVLL